jgi:hypothetical protein
MPRLWATLPTLEGPFIVRPFVRVYLKPIVPRLSRVSPTYPPRTARKPHERIESPHRPTKRWGLLSNDPHPRHKSGR